ncbi:MAG: thymidylate synthase [Chromatiales bacterium]
MRVSFELRDPRQRWITSRIPSINPAFSIAEVVWMVNGWNDAPFLNYWNRQLPHFAGNSLTYYGAYGHRLRSYFEIDQLVRASEVLKANPHSRQVVLQIWNTNSDLPYTDSTPQDADIPCNLMSILKVREGRLDWLQISRSNDIFRGIPYNFVQFTYLQEIVAGWIGIPMGIYTHISDSLHIYEQDTQELSITENPINITNTDIFSLNKEESEILWKELATRAYKLTADNYSIETHRSLSQIDHAPRSFQNILCLLGAESARRRGWNSESENTMRLCKSEILHHLWDSWCRRLANKTKLKT